MWLGENALAEGLVDEVSTSDDVLLRIRGAAAASSENFVAGANGTDLYFLKHKKNVDTMSMFSDLGGVELYLGRLLVRGLLHFLSSNSTDSSPPSFSNPMSPSDPLVLALDQRRWWS